MPGSDVQAARAGRAAHEDDGLSHLVPRTLLAACLAGEATAKESQENRG